MAAESTQAAILILRAKALETYGIIKDMHRRPPEQGDADKIAAHALNLAQYEGAMLTLQQYFASDEEPVYQEPTVVEVEEEEPPTPRVIGPEDSETMRRTLAAHASTNAAKEEDES